jgi:FAD/FMN-containing dehydrogenase
MNGESAAAARELGGRLGEGAVASSGAVYEETCRIWNGAARSRPALVVRARTTGDVQDAVRVARRYGLPLSVRGAGHDWAGRALRDGALVVDVSGMRQVTVDAVARTATVGGGATAADLIEAAAPFGLCAVTGTVGAVGMAGLTLGGGYGLLNGRFGLALDNLAGAELVLADGTAVTVDEDREPELFWAVRGGGGNFGVVTSMRVRLHPVERVVGGRIAYPMAQAATVLDGLNDVLLGAPDELTVQTVVATGPDGEPGIFLVPLWSGDPAEGESRIERLRGLGTPALVQLGGTTYGEVLHMNDAWAEVGNHVTAGTRWVPRFTPGVVAALIEAGRTVTSPMSAVLLHHFHGAASRVPDGETAFGIRRDHFMTEIVAAWPPGDATRHRAWVDGVAAALEPDALPGGYPNMLGPDDHPQIADAYGPNAARLLEAKARFDPDDVFSATSLPQAEPNPG